MICPTFMFAIKDLRTLETDLVRNTIREMWNNDITSKFFQDAVQSLNKEDQEGALATIQSFLDLVQVTRLDTRDPGAALKPTFNVYMNTAIIDSKNLNTWSKIRTHLASRQYYSTRLGQGKAKIAPNHCGLCHGVDHPRGMCPFPLVGGWNGPKGRKQKNTQNRNGPN